LRDRFRHRPGATDHRSLRRLHRFAARLAIIAMLIDGLLPGAVSAAARSAAAPPFMPLCGTAAGAPLPSKDAPVLPMRHCALCTVCSAVAAALPPSRAGGELISRLLAGLAHPAILFSVAPACGSGGYRAAQPRAPPIVLS